MNNLNDEIAVVAKTRKNLGDGPNDCPIDFIIQIYIQLKANL